MSPLSLPQFAAYSSHFKTLSTCSGRVFNSKAKTPSTEKFAPLTDIVEEAVLKESKELCVKILPHLRKTSTPG